MRRRHSAAVALATRRRHSGFGASATMAKEASGFGGIVDYGEVGHFKLGRSP